MNWDRFVLAVFLWLCRTFPSRSRIVPRAEEPDTPMLQQFMLWKGRLYLQRFLCPESRNWFHRHRWAYMRSFVLSGHYVEERPGEQFIEHRARTTHGMDFSTIHRVHAWSEDCVTLFYMSKETREWGYYPAYHLRRAEMVNWRDHIKQRVPSLETGELTE